MAIMSMLEATAVGEDIATLIRSYAEVLNDLVKEEKRSNEFRNSELETRCKTLNVKTLVIDGMTTDGYHHKQWYLVQIAKAIGLAIGEEIDEGTPP